MSYERPVIFACASDELLGILHTGGLQSDVGVVIVVGGPQYRVGSHREFVLIARRLSAAGMPVLRFDCRGMGDSTGRFPSFEEIHSDIRAAVDCMTAELPEVSKVLLLGLCDAASANLMYCASDKRIAGLILLNPWVHTTVGEAKSYLKHYYLQRLFQRSLWRKIVSGEFSPIQSGRDLLKIIGVAQVSKSNSSPNLAGEKPDFISRMREGMEHFREPVLILISGRDLTADEFMDLCRNDPCWKSALKNTRTEVMRMPKADHTLSARQDLEDACAKCIEWVTKQRFLAPQSS